jgi:uncharacterized protein
MKIEYDPHKHAVTLAERALDFRDAVRVFTGSEITYEDTRRDYGEIRFITVGLLDGRMVVIGWTPRLSGGETVRRIFSMRRANEREIEAYLERLG